MRDVHACCFVSHRRWSTTPEVARWSGIILNARRARLLLRLSPAMVDDTGGGALEWLPISPVSSCNKCFSASPIKSAAMPSSHSSNLAKFKSSTAGPSTSGAHSSPAHSTFAIAGHSTPAHSTYATVDIHHSPHVDTAISLHNAIVHTMLHVDHVSNSIIANPPIEFATSLPTSSTSSIPTINVVQLYQSIPIIG
ncbi:hypothetical protein U1Q18_036861 [Sarracenia purpurea var. burkii]